MVVIRIVTPTVWAMEVSRIRQVMRSLLHRNHPNSPAQTMATTVTARVVINMEVNPMVLVEVVTTTTITNMAARAVTAAAITLEVDETRARLRVRREISRCSRIQLAIRLTTLVLLSNTCSKCREHKIKLVTQKLEQQQLKQTTLNIMRNTMGSRQLVRRHTDRLLQQIPTMDNSRLLLMVTTMHNSSSTTTTIMHSNNSSPRLSTARLHLSRPVVAPPPKSQMRQEAPRQTKAKIESAIEN